MKAAKFLRHAGAQRVRGMAQDFAALRLEIADGRAAWRRQNSCAMPRTSGAYAILVIGVDLIKDTKILCPAYNDAEGVTAKFNLNLLARINRELGANFDLSAFEHHACYNGEQKRIEMHLASTKRQKVKVNGKAISFRAGETIHTENSYKYTVESFTALARGTGWSPLKSWSDGMFGVLALKFDGAQPDKREQT